MSAVRGSLSAHEQAWLSRLYPLNLITAQQWPRLQGKLLPVTHEAGEVLLRAGTKSTLKHYLLSGEIELRLSFADRSHLFYDDKAGWCAKPLEELLEAHTDGKAVIKARSSVELLVVNGEYIDELVALSRSASPDVVHIDEVEALIDDSYEEEWTEVFLQTPLASHLSSVELGQLFSQLKEREVQAGDYVVHEDTPGDAFYIVKRGRALVSSQFPGRMTQPVELGPGDYFGDESLIAETPRNASICMSEDGVLCYLDEATFNQLLKPAIVKALTEEDAVQQSLKDKRPLQWVDVRLPIELRGQDSLSCINLPIARLRQYLHKLDPHCRYLISTEGGRRSELAAYLMRQAGLEAYLCRAS